MRSCLTVIQYQEDAHQALDKLKSIMTAAQALTGEPIGEEICLTYPHYNKREETNKEISIRTGIKFRREIAAKKVLGDTTVEAASEPGCHSGRGGFWGSKIR